MEAIGVIEKIEEQTEWVNTFVPVTKPKGQLRICLDPRNLNKSINVSISSCQQETKLLLKCQNITKLDASNRFWQIKLEDESTNLCAFNSPFGRFKYLRLPFGISSDIEIHHRTV